MLIDGFWRLVRLMMPMVVAVLTLSLCAAPAMLVAQRKGDALVTGSVNYNIRDVIDDGTGMTTLMLEAD